MSNPQKRWPVLFIGHGNPLHAISDDAFTRRLGQLGEEMGHPEAVACISAHWMTEGTWVTHMEWPKTIHDFYGFPKELSDVRYPAPGSPKAAELITETLHRHSVNLDDEIWGLDHGSWSVLRHMYPKADVPVVQISIYMEQTADYHFKLGEQLRPLRDQGILIVGSGNIVHNLRLAKLSGSPPPYDWAVELDEWIKQKIEKRDFAALRGDPHDLPNGKLGIPTPDHWYPFVTALGAVDEKDAHRFEYEAIENSSISMRCVSFGRN